MAAKLTCVWRNDATTAVVLDFGSGDETTIIRERWSLWLDSPLGRFNVMNRPIRLAFWQHIQKQ